MKHIFSLIVIVSFVNVSFAKTERDTIPNWQVYSDSQLLFKSHILDSNRYESLIKKSDEFKFLNVSFVSYTRKSYKKRIELICGEKVLITINEITDCFTTKIAKQQINNSIIGYFGKEIYLKYFDDEFKQGIVLGILIFVD